MAVAAERSIYEAMPLRELAEAVADGVLQPTPDEMCLLAQRFVEEQERHAEQESLAAAVALKCLSYSEQQAVVELFKELGGSEGILVASRIADRLGITRSVIVNALRKLESGGVVRCRSLGMRGTHVKVTNPALLAGVQRLNV